VKKVIGPGTEWESLWFSTRQTPWESLALVPNDVAVNVDRIAESLVATGRLHGERPISLMNGCGVHLSEVQTFIDTLAKMSARGEWVIVTVDPIHQNPSAVPIARAASHALLIVRLGESLLPSARSAIKAIGRERLIGSIALDQHF
jgi:hypothetical protein